MRNKDWVKATWVQRRNLAIGLGKSLVESLMKNYHEPNRAGTPKGNLIGLSQKKKRAAVLMILYNPPSGLGLTEIAKIAGVSPGVLRVWRTQGAFIRATSDACDSVRELISNTIHNEYAATFHLPEGLKEPSLQIKGVGQGQARYFLLRVLPFFSPLIAYPVMGFIIDNIESSIPGYAELWLLSTWTLAVKDEKSYLQWRSRPEIKKIYKKIVAIWVDLISDPEAMKELGPKGIKKTAENLKKFIFQELDL